MSTQSSMSVYHKKLHYPLIMKIYIYNILNLYANTHITVAQRPLIHLDDQALDSYSTLPHNAKVLLTANPLTVYLF